MKWIELSVVVNAEAEESVTEILQNAGSNGVAIEDSNEIHRVREDKYGEIFDLNPNDYPKQHMVIKAYYNETQFSHLFFENIKSQISNLEMVDPNVFQSDYKEIEESDWENEWKNYFHPFQASERFYIVPSWETVSKEENHLYIELDPGMAFGTGDHPTTSMCLKAIEKIIEPHHDVIDVGTGSGILSIAAHLLGANHIKAIDLDEMAVQVAKENFVKNHCEAVIETTTGNLLNDESNQYDVVIANILAHVITLMVEDAYARLHSKGYFVASGIIEEKADEIETQMKQAGFKIIETQQDNGWVCITGQKV
ncbi:50S ribosomal protein L11 methyltransferase [Staphylococcus chromogenes]|uniref:50S ribosomal protein L11 methyltransferase n=1 Tax=Staphylococcus chromogenes TaxID=46126 RepID=UPI000D1B1D24|nr:50S ribosomal protein L11 methyltransferase [Staphylococcus chromogenes]MDT0692473.1 50S ribosomal protein L11 methyltransferase [Staphylococcus chromogenes]MDT0700047.1 50S ribosomal protein L11 methyltransferase [Staphylococcus chromogenes]MDU0450518.1 50S ribosomal protein L11 methyltransferase [Staphylococcus chromogenes]PTF67410.1 50S ribosomal protein L11 methyltransferase [Staphylococcus chromogenes]PTF68185.1 50S ribosomal protein L11 methyltransferase [Staphylococcus chromogenes]